MRGETGTLALQLPDSLGAIKAQFDDADLVERRWRQIAQAALALFQVRGYHETTIKDIAREAGISAGLIYHYVSNKQDVLLLVLLDVLEGYRREIPAATEGLEEPLLRLRAAAEAYCRVVAARRDAAVLAYRETKSLDPEYRRLIKRKELESNRLIADCIEDCIAAGHILPVNVELATYQIVMMAHTWALKFWRLRELTTLEDYIEGNLAAIMRGLLTAKGRRRYVERLGFPLLPEE